MKKKRKSLLPVFGMVIGILLMIGSLFYPLLNGLNFGLDLQGGFEVLYQVESIDGSKVTSDMVKSTYKTIGRRIDGLGVSEPSIVVEGTDKIRVQLAGVTDKEKAREILSKAANLSFRDTNDNLLMSSDVLKSNGARISQDEYGRPAVALSIKDNEKFYRVTKKVSEMNDPRIVIWLDYESGDKFSSVEKTCGVSKKNETLKCLSAARVSQGFSGDVIIQGDFTQEEVKELVTLINSGNLPTKLSEISSKTVDASFGSDSLSKTALAGLVGVGLIILFMIATYRFAGVISSIGIIIYTFLTFFIFWLIGGVLTLPGIAALVIGIGMAVDACVISFARIKDEICEGTKLQMAYKLGNKNSFMAIFDSNLTTLLVAIILFIFGESSVKGFATMLIISIFVTMFVMVVVMRFLLKKFVETGYFDDKINFFIGVKEKNIGNKKKNERKKENFKKLNFIKPRKWFYLVSLLLVIVGAISLCMNGLKLGIDFKGGTNITLKTEENVTEELLKKDLEELKLTYQSMEVLNEHTVSLKINDTLEKDKVLETEKYFNEKYKAETDIGVVSNVVKEELTKNAFVSLALALLGMIIYVSFRFRFSYGLTAIVALLHDVFLIVTVFSLFRLEVSSIFIAAILSIVGYSINDTIVTFDRIRENLKKMYDHNIKNREELENVVNTSLRQTLTRSIITTITTLIPVIALIVLGSHEIINFNIALFIGLIVGVYSSICIASELWFDMEKRHVGKKNHFQSDSEELED